ncbi:acetyl-CoA carboxylase biotin carboxyl carrier protein [Streptococcus sp. SQ9-PEA]|uniref:Biotin carboxyl carrier protein of acetyl-CoA carboxylase n=1 Tax=Streptococcus sciuri TaxID=2973939 RepID=A0ABT2F7I8_9STRE|nr:acetyl-CoA carboxylase biotin carboxyl carrier protein [Streptococcus sciuri]MCS4488158.1 acetyl-CoA carboxylase biotin carboxyl carrier protein [Streptococcus sciuri]
MNISDIKELMAQFDNSSLREFSYRNANDDLHFSKNSLVSREQVTDPILEAPLSSIAPQSTSASQASLETANKPIAEGELVESPLVGVAYLASAPDKPNFVAIGETVKKGQTLLIIEAMKVMNEVLAPKDGVVTEILVENEEVVEFGKGLVRIK